jgi:hypothetical protein
MALGTPKRIREVADSMSLQTWRWPQIVLFWAGACLVGAGLFWLQLWLLGGRFFFLLPGFNTLRGTLDTLGALVVRTPFFVLALVGVPAFAIATTIYWVVARLRAAS